MKTWAPQCAFREILVESTFKWHQFYKRQIGVRWNSPRKTFRLCPLVKHRQTVFAAFQDAKLQFQKQALHSSMASPVSVSGGPLTAKRSPPIAVPLTQKSVLVGIGKSKLVD